MQIQKSRDPERRRKGLEGLNDWNRAWVCHVLDMNCRIGNSADFDRIALRASG